ncbi:MAG: hypothetical protein RR588_12535 [Solibacillus sp.]
MSKPYKDRIVDEIDGAPRFNIVKRDGTIATADVKIELSSAVLQAGDKFGANEINTFITRNDDNTITTNFLAREDY